MAAAAAAVAVAGVAVGLVMEGVEGVVMAVGLVGFEIVKRL
jgi:hypothetical protein